MLTLVAVLLIQRSRLHSWSKRCGLFRHSVLPEIERKYKFSTHTYHLYQALRQDVSQEMERN